MIPCQFVKDYVAIDYVNILGNICSIESIMHGDVIFFVLIYFVGIKLFVIFYFNIHLHKRLYANVLI